MGREWYWTRSMRRGGEREMSSAAGSTTTAAGCITSLLHLFDFHQFQCSSSPFPSPASSSSSASASASSQKQQQQQQLSSPPKKQPMDAAADDLFLLQYSISDKKGVEAPRNSLEMDVDPLMVAASPSPISVFKEAEGDIPFCIQLLPVKASPSLQRDQEDNYQKSPTSQGSKTPNLVARLMGLDLLPGEIASATSSPVFRTPSRKLPYSRHLKDSGSRSLPDTPRMSSARRSDVDPRLSLQINKENIDMSEFNSRISKENTLFSNSALISARRGGKRESKFRSHEEGKSPNRYVKEMVKQVKESVSRKVGADITNLRNQGRGGEKNSAINVGIKKTKGKEEQNQNKNTTPSSSSPRLRFFESKNTKVEAEDQSIKQVKTPSPGSPPAQLKKMKTKARSPMPKCGTKFDKASCERFTRKPKKSCHSEGAQSLREDVLRRAAFSKQQCYQIEGHVAVPSKPDPDPNQASSSSCPGQGPTPLETRDDNTVTAEFRYVRAILNRTGIHYTRSPAVRCYSPSHPLDPSLFRTLESASSSHLHVSTLRLRPNRKLLFHLADEILAGLLRPHFNLKPWMHITWRHPVCGDDLSVQLWAWVREFRGADCQTLQDIDGLVGSDFREKPGGGSTWRLTEEREAIACEIEREIAESLLEEAVSGLTQPGPIWAHPSPLFRTETAER